MVLFDFTMHDPEAELAGLNRRLEALGAHYRWPTRAQGALQVGLDEWISNIIEHGYRDTGGRGPVRVVVAVSGEATGRDAGAEAGAIFARVEDWGPGFDPTRVMVPVSGPAQSGVLTRVWGRACACSATCAAVCATAAATAATA